MVVDPGDVTVDLGPLSPTQRVELEAEIDPLAGTGQNIETMSLGALMLIAIGSLLLAGARLFGSTARSHRIGRRRRGVSP
jgi:hypothetical protein